MSSDRAQSLFRILIVAAIVAAFGQVTFGGIVRVTDSGLGCPDWPLCHGQIIPPFEKATMIEYGHRLSASVLGVFVFANAVIVWMYLRRASYVLYSSIAALVLVIIASALGGATVLTELEWWVRLIHLTVAELLVASLIVAAVGGWKAIGNDPRQRIDGAEGKIRTLVVISIVGALVLILSGSYMVGYGAGTSCGTWPLCRGSLFPEGTAYSIHMGHRFVAAIVGLIILGAAYLIWRASRQHKVTRFASGSVIVSFIVQIIFGAVLVWSGFSIDIKALHLSLATLVWGALITMSALVYLPHQSVDVREAVLRHRHV